MMGQHSGALAAATVYSTVQKLYRTTGVARHVARDLLDLLRYSSGSRIQPTRMKYLPNESDLLTMRPLAL